jgi:hypothetical protein
MNKRRGRGEGPSDNALMGDGKSAFISGAGSTGNAERSLPLHRPKPKRSVP